MRVGTPIDKDNFIFFDDINKQCRFVHAAQISIVATSVTDFLDFRQHLHPTEVYRTVHTGNQEHATKKLRSQANGGMDETRTRDLLRDRQAF